MSICVYIHTYICRLLCYSCILGVCVCEGTYVRTTVYMCALWSTQCVYICTYVRMYVSDRLCHICSTLVYTVVSQFLMVLIVFR